MISQVFGVVASLVLAAAAFYAWLLTRNASMYASFDSLYQNILDIGLNNPELRDREKTRDYKKCRLLPIVADRHWLQKTWLPVIVFEMELHGSWLDDPARPRPEFKDEFLKYMQSDQITGRSAQDKEALS